MAARVVDKLPEGEEWTYEVKFKQVQKQTGQMQERTITDGQQRLTTLQLLLN
jgi:uncharacterized protein with ParB-like and HNH nuclease domain